MHRVDVRIRAAVKRAVERGKPVVGMNGVHVLLRLLDDIFVAEREMLKDLLFGRYVGEKVDFSLGVMKKMYICKIKLNLNVRV